MSQDVKGGVARERQRQKTFGNAAQAVVLPHGAVLESARLGGEILESASRGKRQTPKTCGTR